jgi:hypothetical protein
MGYTLPPLRLSYYLDDWLFMHPPRKLDEILVTRVWPVTAGLGFFWGSKSQWEVAAATEHLGLLVDAAQRKVFMRPIREVQMRDEVRYIVKVGRVKVSTVLRLVGRLRAYQLAIPNAHVIAWALGRKVAELVNKTIPNPLQWTPQQLSKAWQWILVQQVELTPMAMQLLHWLAKHLAAVRGRHWDDVNAAYMAMDAGPKRIGAKCAGTEVSVQYPVQWAQAVKAGQSVREVIALPLAVGALLPQLRGKRLIVESDCMGGVATFNRMRSGALAPWVAEGILYCMERA